MSQPERGVETQIGEFAVLDHWQTNGLMVIRVPENRMKYQLINQRQAEQLRDWITAWLAKQEEQSPVNHCEICGPQKDRMERHRCDKHREASV